MAAHRGLPCKSHDRTCQRRSDASATVSTALARTPTSLQTSTRSTVFPYLPDVGYLEQAPGYVLGACPLTVSLLAGSAAALQVSAGNIWVPCLQEMESTLASRDGHPLASQTQLSAHYFCSSAVQREGLYCGIIISISRGTVSLCNSLRLKARSRGGTVSGRRARYTRGGGGTRRNRPSRPSRVC